MPKIPTMWGCLSSKMNTPKLTPKQQLVFELYKSSRGQFRVEPTSITVSHNAIVETVCVNDKVYRISHLTNTAT
jgi:hypothetical protein